MFRKESSSNKINGEGQKNSDAIGSILVEEIRSDIGQFEQEMKTDISFSSGVTALSQYEKNIEVFVQKIKDKSQPIRDHVLVRAVNLDMTHVLESLRVLIHEKRVALQQRTESFTQSSDVKAALDRCRALFPEKDLETCVLMIGGKDRAQLSNELRKMGHTSEKGYIMMSSSEFTTLSTQRPILLLKVSVRDLGFTEKPTLDQLNARATKLGLELCPAEVGPHLRLEYTEAELLYVGMEPISTAGSSRDVFRIGYRSSRWWLNDRWGTGSHYWGLESDFVFKI